MSKSFFETLAMFSMRIQLFNSVNNSEYMSIRPPPLHTDPNFFNISVREDINTVHEKKKVNPAN